MTATRIAPRRTVALRLCVAVSVAWLAVDAGLAAPPNFPVGTTFTGTYNVANTTETSETTGGAGLFTFAGVWNATQPNSRTVWRINDGAKILVSSSALINNNEAALINAKPHQIIGMAANTGAFNEVLEFAAGWKADQGTQAAKVGGLSVLRVYNARLITHGSESLPTIWKLTTDKTGVIHDTHHGLLIFERAFGSPVESATSTEWHVKTADHVYDGGLYWHVNLALDVAAGVTLSSNTHYEQSIVGPHVGFGTRADNAVLTKTGEGRIVVARGGIQGYRSGSVIDIRQGEVEFNSDPTQVNPNAYLVNTGQNLAVKVADGAAVRFHAYSWPDTANWYQSYAPRGPESLHRIRSLQTSGLVRLGGLWNPTADPWDIHYDQLMTLIRPETANSREARLEVSGDAAFASQAVMEIVLGSASHTDDYQVKVGGLLTQAGILRIIDDGTLAIGDYDLFDAGSFAGAFALELPAGYVGTYSSTSGILSLTAVPEPTGAVLLVAAGLILARRRRG